MSERGITLRLSDDASEWLALRGYDAQYGARPLQRVIQNTVQNPLAEGILEGRFGDGDYVEVRVDPAEGKLIFGVGSASKTGELKGGLTTSAADVAGNA